MSRRYSSLTNFLSSITKELHRDPKNVKDLQKLAQRKEQIAKSKLVVGTRKTLQTGKEYGQGAVKAAGEYPKQRVMGVGNTP